MTTELFDWPVVTAYLHLPLGRNGANPVTLLFARGNPVVLDRIHAALDWRYGNDGEAT